MKAAKFLHAFFSLALLQRAVADDVLSIVENVDSGFEILKSLLSIDDPALLPVTERLSGTAFTTLFAPTDAAFEKLPESTLTFLQNSPGALAEVLLYHAVDGRFRFRRVADFLLDTLQGNQIFVSNKDFGFTCYFGICRNEFLTVNSATVVSKNIFASNGFVHTIDEVLIPPGVVIFDVLQTAGKGDSSTLLATAEVGGLDAVLGGAGPFTLLAPTDDAFMKLPIGYLETLSQTENASTLEDILLYHVIPNSEISADSFSNGEFVQTANGLDVFFIVDGTRIRIRDGTSETALIQEKDIAAINGVVHTIDKVLLPSSIELPEQTGIINVLSEDPELSVLVGMLRKQPSVLQIIARDAALTFFAPVNAAFEQFSLPSYANEETVLLYHVGGQQLTKQNLIDFTILNIPTFQGTGLDSTYNRDGDVFVEDAKIIEADIMASNGIIHKIDSVLVPPDPNVFSCPLPAFLCDFVQVVAEEIIENVLTDVTDAARDIISIFFP